MLIHLMEDEADDAVVGAMVQRLIPKWNASHRNLFVFRAFEMFFGLLQLIFELSPHETN